MCVGKKKLVNSDPLIEITRAKRTALQKEKHTFQDKSLTLTGVYL